LLCVVCLASPALAAVSVPDGSWGGEARVPGAASATGPASCSDGANLNVAFAVSTGAIGIVEESSGSWSAVQFVTGTKVTPNTTLTPGITIYKSDFYVFWTNTSGSLKYSSLSGIKWQPTRSVSGKWGSAESSEGPAVTVANGALYVAWKNKSDDSIDYSSLTAAGWAKPVTAVSNATPDGPTIAPTGIAAKPLMLAWTRVGGGISYGVVESKGFKVLGTVPEAATNRSPKLTRMTATPGGTMYLGWKGTHSDKIWYAKISNVAGSSLKPAAWSKQTSLPAKFLTGARPTLTAVGSKLFAIWRGRSTDDIWFASAMTP
jgi:hypothetical protein